MFFSNVSSVISSETDVEPVNRLSKYESVLTPVEWKESGSILESERIFYI
jgi:hypothetical protein